MAAGYRVRAELRRAWLAEERSWGGKADLGSWNRDEEGMQCSFQPSVNSLLLPLTPSTPFLIQPSPNLKEKKRVIDF